jgi:acetoin:2,6-dichlorophenolindophenol oxidoreductase subunit alpha
MHLTAPDKGLMGCSAIVGGTLPVAVGDALAAKIRKEKRVVVSVFGDGAVGEGVFFESLNFALLKNLPVVFVLENNGYAVNSPLKNRARDPRLYRLGLGMGLRGERHDGNDALKVHAAAQRALEKVRRGGAPLPLEFITDRWNEHVGPGMDWTAPYRPKGEEKRSRARDPLVQTRRILSRKYRVSEDEFRQLEQEIQKDIEAAVAFAEKSPFPSPGRLMEDVFA